MTEARGAELSTDVAPAAGWHLRAGYTLLDSEIVDSTSPTSTVLQPGKWLFRRPRHSGFFGVSWSQGRVAADLTGLFVGRFVDSDFASLQPPILEHDSYTTWDARLSVKIVPRAVFLLSIDNLADADYMEPLGYPALGRAVRAFPAFPNVGSRSGARQRSCVLQGPREFRVAFCTTSPVSEDREPNFTWCPARASTPASRTAAPRCIVRTPTTTSSRW